MAKIESLSRKSKGAQAKSTWGYNAMWVLSKLKVGPTIVQTYSWNKNVCPEAKTNKLC